MPRILNLHSNMVRFIIKDKILKTKNEIAIYIPIWLDLLSHETCTHARICSNLHSNMVRFIIFAYISIYAMLRGFTFQYG